MIKRTPIKMEEKYMKKIFKIISLVMMMVMCFSVTAFAAETNETSNLKVSFTDEGMTNSIDEDGASGVSVQASAPAVTSVKVVDAQIKSDGYVYVSVQVAGYGKNIHATYDGMQCSVSSTTSVGRPIVTGYIYEVKCAEAVVGAHKFTFEITSINYPWNTVSTSSVITVSQK